MYYLLRGINILFSLICLGNLRTLALVVKRKIWPFSFKITLSHFKVAIISSLYLAWRVVPYYDCVVYNLCLHMSQLTRMAQFPRSCLTSNCFVTFSMCSYERAVWLVSWDLGFSNRVLGKWAENVVIWSLQPGYRDKLYRPGWLGLALPVVFSTY